MGKLKSYLDQGISFCQEAWTELLKVHYPSPKETMQATLVVVVLAFVMAIWLGLTDWVSTEVVRQLLR
jgi:preprotein translocase SecE subunit